MNERRAKLCHWAGANTGLGETRNQDCNGRASRLPNPAAVGPCPSTGTGGEAPGKVSLLIYHAQ